MADAIYYERVPLRRREGKTPEQRIMDRLHVHARRAFPAGVHHVTLAQVAALGRGDVEAGEQILHQMFRMSGPRAIHPTALRELGNGDIAAGRRVVKKFLDQAHDEHQHTKAVNEPEGREYLTGGAIKCRIIWQPDRDISCEG